MSRLKSAALLALIGAASALVVFLFAHPGDYPQDAGPAIAALLDGRLADFFSQQPLMGSFSVLVRAPFALLARLVDGGDLLVYQLGAFPCVLAAGLVGLALARELRARGRPGGTCFFAGALCLFNPGVAAALRWGHPEEILGASLCVGAVLLALRNRGGLAGLALGLALATKQWAVLAVAPVLLAAPGRRLRLLATAGLAAALLTIPLAFGNAGRFGDVAYNAATTPPGVARTTVWRLLATPEEKSVEVAPGEVVVLRPHIAPAWLGRVAHPLIVLLAVPFAFLFWRRRGPGLDAAGLLALFFLLRAVLDPVNNEYYHAPFLLTILVWESLRFRRLPLISMLAATALLVTYAEIEPTYSGTATNLFYLGWTLPLLAYLCASVFRWPTFGLGSHPQRGSLPTPRPSSSM